LLESFYRVAIGDFTLNIILFVPFGFLSFLLLGNSSLGDYKKVFLCVILGAFFSFIIETYQLFLPRDSELSDVFMNAGGSLLGAILARRYYDRVFGVVRTWWLRTQGSVALLSLVVLLYAVAFLGISLFPIRYVDLRNWDPDFTFQVANEATLDRPWIGRIYIVAIYNRDLSRDEIYTNFKAGPGPLETGLRVREGLVAFYDFKEGGGKTIYDSSGFGPPLDLTIQDPSRVRWLIPNGLEVLDNTILKTKEPAKKLYDAIKPNNSLTVEVWMAPGNTIQKGPARIVSFSKDTGNGNLTLGQEEKNIHLRVRTPLSGPTGSYVNLRTGDGFLEPGNLYHIVATYKEGIETLFVNGKEHTSVALFDSIKSLGFFGNNVLSRIAFSFFFFFPMVFFLYLLFLNVFGKTMKSSFFTVFLACGLLLLIEVILNILFPNKGFDFNLLFAAVPVGLLTLLWVRFLETEISALYPR
jgi:glycopeptide antibiotics resistance protein